MIWYTEQTMLTKEDVQELRTVIREEVEAEAQVTRKEAATTVMRLETRFQRVENSVKDIAISNTKFAKEQEQILDTVSMIFQTVGEQHDKLTERVEKIEDQLGISHKN